MRRRRLLKLVGAAGAGLSVAGCVELGGDPDPTPSPDPTPTPETPDDDPDAIPYADRFETVYDLAEQGADTTGQESIVGLLEELIGDETLLYLPEGEYLVDAGITHRSFQHLGIVGENATIVPPDGFAEVFFDLGRPGQASGLLFEGITFDFRASDTGSRPLGAQVDDGLVVRDLAVTGRQDAGWGMLRVDVTHPDGAGLVERLRLPDGATVETASNGCLVGDDNRGKIRFLDCHIEGFPDNGLYADPLEGSVEVLGGYYANNNVSNVRVGDGGTVRGVHVRCDAAPTGYGNMRGIRLNHGRDVLVENCTVEMVRVVGSDGAITLGKELASATVRNTDIRVDADGINAVTAKFPKNVPADEQIALEGVRVTGDAANNAAVEIQERVDCLVEDCHVEQHGPDRDGLLFKNGARAVVRDTRIDVTGRPIVSVANSSVTVRNSHPAELNDSPSDVR